MAPYIIWDWNGTLLDDVDAAVYALNHLLSERGIPTITRDFYRAHFGFPSRNFYIELGMDPDRDWERICVDFHRHIAEGPQAIRPDAVTALELARDHGCGQSILSALRQDLLLRDTGRDGIHPFFDEIYGVDNLEGASKLARGRQLIAQLCARGLLPAERPVYFIGDTLHDAEVAAEFGATPVLVDQGHQTAERLAASGGLVADSLPSAVRLILKRSSLI